MNKDTYRMLNALERAGISTDDALTLRRISITLHRWHELECGDGNNYGSWTLERDEKTDVPYGARKRLDAILARYPDLSAYVQGDPRGCALWILRTGDVPEGEQANAYYTNGLPVYK